MTAPLIFEWTGEEMALLSRFAKLADKEFVIGEQYRMEVREERSVNSHNHYFASLHDAWMTLPEHEAERFPTETHLRKWALIKAGFRDERTYAAASKADALRLAAFIKPMDEYAVIVVHEAAVHVLTAKSQKQKLMGKRDFQRSKEAVLEIAWGLVGMRPEEAAPHIGKAA